MDQTAIDRARDTARARRDICTPRGKHRPTMTKRFVVDGEPYRYRLCGDCHSWVDPTPIYAQDTVRGAVVP